MQDRNIHFEVLYDNEDEERMSQAGFLALAVFVTAFWSAVIALVLWLV